MADEQPIIVVKKKGGHGGHHGGAWKVAYADFVTAMMSLFIVLWLMNASKPIQEAVGGYFRDPLGTAKKTGSAMAGAGEASPVKKEDMARLKQDLMKAMEKMADFDKLKKQIEMTITPEGLQIEMMESPQGTFFENGKAQPTELMQNLLKVLSVEVGKLPNPITIEGHTDSKPFSDSPLYSNWELSTDRGNAARRLMESSGLRPNQVVQVRGFADQKLRKPKQPEDPSNRRVTLIIQYVNPPAGPPPTIVTNGTLPQANQLTAPVPSTSKEPAPATKEAKSEK
jgi:chemotaxis protein MotB